MKRIIALLLALVMVLAFASCSVQPQNPSCDTCTDKDADSVCDVCGKKIQKPATEDPANALTVADFAKAMKDMSSSRVAIKVVEASALGELTSTYTITFGNGETATISYVRELWDVSENIFETTAPAKKAVPGVIHYANGTYTGEMEGTANVVAKLALNLVADQLASVQITGTDVSGATLIAAVPRANSASVLGVALPADAAISVTMNAGAKSISAFTLSYADGENQVAFSALYQ